MSLWSMEMTSLYSSCISQVLSTEEIVSNMVDSIKEVTHGKLTIVP